MPPREIVTHPNPVLRAQAHKVRQVTDSTRQLIDDMVETMRLAPGVGLAAPQVGVSQRVIVVEYSEPAEEGDGDGAARPPKLYAVVNPEITRRSAEIVSGTEGCLSIPGYLGTVDRHAWVTVKGLNRHGHAFRLKAHGWLARIFQHEIDHVNGILYIDHASEVWRPEPEETVPAPEIV